MWEWILANSGWLIPLFLFVGNEVVKRTETEVDNDIWKVVSYILEKVFGTINKSKAGSSFDVYSSEEQKPKVVRWVDKAAESLKEKTISKSKN